MSRSVPLELIAAIHSHDKFLCVSHVNADGDAYGSVLGMTHLLRNIGLQATPVMPEPVSPDFAFLPGAEEVLSPEAVDVAEYDFIICLDMSSPDRMGALQQAAEQAQTPLLVIDHHVTNTRFGVVNWVEPNDAATCQMLTRLADKLFAPIDPDAATCLLTGIVTDTLCFRTSNTTPEVMEAATRLQRKGASLPWIVQKTLNRLPFRILRLWGDVLPGVQLRERVVWAAVTQEQLRAADCEDDDPRLNSVLASVEEADMSAIFTEKRDETGRPIVECSFRAKPGFNVGDLAFRLGGGGHAPASGCTLPGSLAEVVDRVVALLIQERKRQEMAIEGDAWV
ncbi:DHH family phosphoesterase [Caldilinea sp.]|uniref:DHH family phosphoesterase n=1 Tax=Caldilinea sp. TaxID=2293560 RepID=UPI0021DCCF33|nr:bifunctional oligoribonuclease/PAP phosphatase NrnA [Caldilinea sp.]GIV69680.1 MAG: phosphoesterase [Caldilinea sp.]